MEKSVLSFLSSQSEKPVQSEKMVWYCFPSSQGARIKVSFLGEVARQNGNSCYEEIDQFSGWKWLDRLEINDDCPTFYLPLEINTASGF